MKSSYFPILVEQKYYSITFHCTSKPEILESFSIISNFLMASLKFARKMSVLPVNNDSTIASWMNIYCSYEHKNESMVKA